MDIQIMSQVKAVNQSGSFMERTAIISITAPGQMLPVFQDNPNIIGIFRMCFYDISSEVMGLEVPKQQDFDGLRLFVDDMTEKHVDTFVVHCAAGISRSAGVAAALGEYLSLDVNIFENPAYYPNRLVYRLALNELGLRFDEEDQIQSFRKRILSLDTKNILYQRYPDKIVRNVLRLLKKGKSVESIARRCFISVELAEKIVEICLTYPELGEDDILKRLGKV